MESAWWSVPFVNKTVVEISLFLALFICTDMLMNRQNIVFWNTDSDPDDKTRFREIRWSQVYFYRTCILESPVTVVVRARTHTPLHIARVRNSKNINNISFLSKVNSVGVVLRNSQLHVDRSPQQLKCIIFFPIEFFSSLLFSSTSTWFGWFAFSPNRLTAIVHTQ